MDGRAILKTLEDAAAPLSMPLNVENLERIAPAVLIVGGFDPLRDKCKTQGDRLNGAGAATEFRCDHTTIHGFMSCPSALKFGRTALRDRAA